MTFSASPVVIDPACDYQPIALGHLFPHAAGEFEIYLRQGDTHILFAKSGEALTPDRRGQLVEHGVEVVYIHRDELDRYRGYMRRHLGAALLGRELDRDQKAAVFYHHCSDIVCDLLRDRLPQGLADVHGRLFVAYAREIVAALCTESGFARMGALMRHDYDVYSHGMHVFVYAVFLLKSLGMSRSAIVEAGLGALLHDSGKEAVDASILRKPGRLTTSEFDIVREHPGHGVRLCRPLGLSRQARECILAHHERLDGRGYPQGLSGKAIPLHVRVVSLADVYDALTSHRVYADAVQPFEALRIMRDEMAGAFDLDLYKRFVMLLSGAALL